MQCYGGFFKLRTEVLKFWPPNLPLQNNASHVKKYMTKIEQTVHDHVKTWHYMRRSFSYSSTLQFIKKSAKVKLLSETRRRRRPHLWEQLCVMAVLGGGGGGLCDAMTSNDVAVNTDADAHTKKYIHNPALMKSYSGTPGCGGVSCNIDDVINRDDRTTAVGGSVPG